MARYSAKSEAKRVAEALEAHDRLDTERFAALTSTLDEIRADVKSLIESRSYVRGAWKAIVAISLTVSTVAGIVVAWLKH